MKYRFLFIALMLCFIINPAFGQAPVISNISVQQRGGEDIVDISYDLSASSEIIVRVSIFNDNEDINANSITGNGKGFVSPGEEKTLVWNAGEDFPNQYSEEMTVKFEAIDVDYNVVFTSELFTVDTRVNKPPVDGWQTISNNGNTFNEQILIDNKGKIWCFYLKSTGTRPDYCLKVLDEEGYIYKTERVVAHGSALVTGKHQTIRAAVNKLTGNVWAVFQGSHAENQTGFFVIFNDTAGIKQDSTALTSTTDAVNAPKVAAALNGDMWFSWHGGIPRTANAIGEYIRYTNYGEPVGSTSTFLNDADNGLFNTDIAVDKNNRIWLLVERSEDDYKSQYYISNTEKVIISSGDISSDNFYFDPRMSIYADTYNDRIWVLQKNIDSTYYRINGYYLVDEAVNTTTPILSTGICSFIMNENRNLEVVRYNPTNQRYQFREYNGTTGAIIGIDQWQTLFSGLPNPGPVDNYVAYNEKYSTRKVYLAHTDTELLKVKLKDAVLRTAAIAAIPDTIRFGSVGTDTIKTSTFRIKNIGTEIVNIQNISSSNARFTVNKTEIELNPGDSTTVTVTFSPNAVGDISGIITITSNADSGTETVYATGSGYIRTWSLTTNPTALNFGEVSTISVKRDSFYVRNIGNQRLTITNITSSNDRFTILQQDRNFSLSVGDSHIVRIDFTPNAESIFNGTANIYSNAGVEPHQVSLTGRGYVYTAANFFLEPTSIDFDSVLVGESSTDSFIVKNTGNLKLEVRSVVSNDARFAVLKEDSVFNVSPGDSHTVEIVFTPTSTKTYEGTITFINNDPETPEIFATVTGRGFSYGTPHIVVSKQSVTFQDVIVGQSDTNFVDIINTGTNVLKIESISLKDSFYIAYFDTAKWGTKPELHPNDSEKPFMRVNVIFTPTRLGDMDATLYILSNDPEFPQKSISVVGSSRNAAPPEISLPPSLAFENAIVSRKYSTQFYMGNTGEQNLMISGYRLNSSQFSLSGDSTRTLAPKQYLEYTLKFNPTQTGTIQDTLTFLTNDPNNPQAKISLIANNVRELYDQKIYVNLLSLEFETTALGKSTYKYIRIYNQGEKNLKVTSLSTNESQFIVDLDSFTVYPGSYKPVPIRFEPINATEISGQLTILSNDPKNGEVNVSLSGMGRNLGPANITSNLTTLNFQTVAVNHSVSKYIQIKNTGESILSVSNIELINDNSNVFTVSPKSFQLNPGSYRWVNVIYTPVAVEVSQAQMVVKSNDDDLSINLVGIGRELLAADISVSHELYNFEDVGLNQQSSFYLQIRNYGETTLSGAIALSDTTNYTISASSFTINGGQYRNILVIFQPTTIGQLNCQLNISSNDPETPKYTVNLNGQGRELQLQNIVIQPTSIDFGSVAIERSVVHYFLVNNSGEADLLINGITSTNANIFQVKNESFTVMAGRSRYIAVTFEPVEKRVYEAAIQISSNDPDRPYYELPVQGEGRELLGPIATLNPDSLNFGGVAVNDTLSLPVIIQNTGEEVLQISSVNRGETDNYWVSKDNFEIEPGHYDMYYVTFNPTSLDTFPALIEFVDNSDSATILKVTGFGRDSIAAQLVYNDDGVNFGKVAIGNSFVREFTVSNGGELPLSIQQISIDSSAFTVDTTSFTLLKHQQETLEIQFQPVKEDTIIASLKFIANGEMVSVPLYARGREFVAQTIGVLADTLSFGKTKIASAKSLPVTVYNYGDATLQVSNVLTSDTQFTPNTDGFSVAPGLSYSFNVSFVPQQADSISAFLYIQSNDPVRSTYSIFLSGTGVEPDIQKIDVTPNPVKFPLVSVNATGRQSLWISNIGEDTLKVTNIISNNSVFSTSFSTPFNILAGEYEQVYIYFSPTEVKTYEANIQIINNDPLNDTLAVRVEGTARVLGPPQIAIATDTLKFEATPVSNLYQRNILIQNIGESTLHVKNVSTSTNSRFSAQVNEFSVLSQNSYYLSIGFKPDSIGTFYDSLKISSDDPTDSTVTIYLYGIGRKNYPQKIEVSTTELNFGTTVINRPVTKSFRISNTGESKLTVLNIGLQESFAKEFQFSSSWMVLEPGTYQDINVTYNPTTKDTIGIEFEIRSNDPDHPNNYVKLTARCLNYFGPQLSISHSFLNFGSLIVGGHKEQRFYISNLSSQQALQIDSISVNAQYRTIYQISPASFSVPPLGQREVIVEFSPELAQYYNANLTVHHNDQYPGRETIDIYARGTQSSGSYVLNQISGWTVNTPPYPYTNIFSSTTGTVYFVKDIYITDIISSAHLFLFFADSIDFYINGSLVLSAKTTRADTSFVYDIQDYDVSPYLLYGRNRVAAKVYYNGGYGAFDCALLVNGEPVIKHGHNYSSEQLSWWNYFNYTGSGSTSPITFETRYWFDFEYGWSGADTLLTSFEFEPGINPYSVWDASSYGRQATFSNLTWKRGIRGQALEFTGNTNSHVSFQASLNGFPRTFQLWFNNYGKQSHIQTILSNSMNNSNGRGMYLDTNNILYVYSRNGAISTGYTILPNRWYFVALQYLSGQIRVIVDRTVVATFTITGQEIGGSVNTYLGGNPMLDSVENGFYGMIDDLVITNTAPVNVQIPNVMTVSSADTITSASATNIPVSLIVKPAPFEMQSAEFQYAIGGENNFKTINATVTDTTSVDSMLTFTIPAVDVNIRGLRYKLQLETNYGTMQFPDDGSSIWVPVSTVQESAHVVLRDTIYQMVSIPYNLDSTSITSIFQDNFGEYDPYNWRLFRWLPNQKMYEEYNDSSSAGWENIGRGEAVWLVTKERPSFNAGAGWSALDNNDVRIELQPGWNQIANPFPFPVRWTDIQLTANDDQVSDPFYYQTAGTSIGFLNWSDYNLEPWKGYFVENLDSTSSFLIIPPVAATSTSLDKQQGLVNIPSKYQDAALLISLDITRDNYSDRNNFIGIIHGASDNLDRFDNHEPPHIKDGIYLSLQNNVEKSKKFSADFRSWNNDGQIWIVNIENAKLKRTSSTFNVNLHTELPAGWLCYLFDLKSDVAYNLLEKNSFVLNDGKKVHNYKLIAGTESFVNSNNGGIPLIPLSFELFNNYPNPFNPSTTISFNISQRTHVEIQLYNILGQRIRTLIDQTMRGGHHQLVWDGTNERGISVASGLYFVHLKAEGKHSVKKMMIIK
ncbi:choice-of-anchor D domain-containing protein [candidate division KSB1 bacterium]|nr:choice-of-anchor D domain-containing protein [candidate division KSB1 bacterium]